jgi:hypothetical protein
MLMSGLRRSLLLAALLLTASSQALLAQGGYRPQDVVTLERSVRFLPGTGSAVMRNTIRAG